MHAAAPRSASAAARNFNRNPHPDSGNSAAIAGIDSTSRNKETCSRRNCEGRMRKLCQSAGILGLLLTLSAGATAVGDDMVAIKLSNDGTDDRSEERRVGKEC